jgi:PAS domain S-box-containing protein
MDEKRKKSGATRSRASGAILSAVVNSSDDAIISKTVRGVILTWNKAAEGMFGYSESEAIGQNITLIIPPERRAEEEYVLEQILQGKKVDHFETVRLTKDGRKLDISLTVSPITSEKGEILGASKIARNITERKRLEREREALLAAEQEARRELTEALSIRDEFVGVAAHELRSPLHSAMMSVELLRRLSANPEGLPRLRSHIEKIKTQLDRFTLLVDRLLDVTRIRAGIFQLSLEKFKLGRLIHEVVDRFPNERIEISLDVEQNVEVCWDRVRTDQAITNLVSNAVKYGQKKPILLAASADSSCAIVSVRDEGIGISPDGMKRVFDRFERLSPNAGVDGMGLGLWITKQIVEKHGGTISVESTLGKGSIFTISLPLKKV